MDGAGGDVAGVVVAEDSVVCDVRGPLAAFDLHVVIELAAFLEFGAGLGLEESTVALTGSHLHDIG